MKNVEYEIAGVIYGVSQLHAGAIDRLEGEPRERLIKSTALAKRDKEEPKPKAKPAASAAKQGPVSSLHLGTKKDS